MLPDEGICYDVMNELLHSLSYGEGIRYKIGDGDDGNLMEEFELIQLKF
ncbi:hypothetical protein Lser_V15G41793 [Lactuca serriola]